MPDPADFAVGLVIPTLNAGPGWSGCLEAIRCQTQRLRRSIIVDSASTDDTASRARAMEFEVFSIARATFNHGGTRQWAAELLTDCDIVLYMTQDAIPADPLAFAHLIDAFVDPSVAVAYGRQLPHKGATLIERHARIFNYRAETEKKNLDVLARHGSKVFFCSNSFAAYRRKSLMALGGFRDDLILGEDMEFAARAVRAGYTNVYRADARVLHSHNYSASQTFSRYFDIGVFDAENTWMQETFGSHRGEGMRFVKSELAYLWKEGPWQIPRALLQTAAKLAGYRAGRLHRHLSPRLKRRLSMLPVYWK